MNDIDTTARLLRKITFDDMWDIYYGTEATVYKELCAGLVECDESTPILIDAMGKAVDAAEAQLDKYGWLVEEFKIADRLNMNEMLSNC